MPNILLVLDLDGTVSPVTDRRPRVWGDEVEVTPGVWASPDLCSSLQDLGDGPGVTPVWMTSWSPEMREPIEGLPGRDWDAILREDFESGDGDGWWKLSALRGWIDEFGPFSGVVWVDDDLPPADRDVHDLTVEDIEGALHEVGVPEVRLCPPLTSRGITLEIIWILERWVRDLVDPPAVGRYEGTARGLPQAKRRTWRVVATESDDDWWHVEYGVVADGVAADSCSGGTLGEQVGDLMGRLRHELLADYGCESYELEWLWSRWDDPGEPQPRANWFRGRQPRVPRRIDKTGPWRVSYSHEVPKTKMAAEVAAHRAESDSEE